MPPNSPCGRSAGEAGVSARYFYESFTDKDELVAAVFDWVIADIAATTQAAVSAPRRRSRTGQAWPTSSGPSPTTPASAGCCSVRSSPTRCWPANARKPAP